MLKTIEKINLEKKINDLKMQILATGKTFACDENLYTRKELKIVSKYFAILETLTIIDYDVTNKYLPGFSEIIQLENR